MNRPKDFRLKTWLTFFPAPDGRAHLIVSGIVGSALYDVHLDRDLNTPVMEAELRHLKERYDVEPGRVRASMRVFANIDGRRRVECHPGKDPIVVAEQNA